MSTSRRSRSYATADCPDCGDIGPVSTKDIEAARRWCRRHADDNPGHGVHLETSSLRIYRQGGDER